MSTISRVSSDSSGETLLTFGRYMGKTFEYVKNTDISYCNWALKQVKPNGRMKEFQNYLQGLSNFATCERCNGTGKVHIM